MINLRFMNKLPEFDEKELITNPFTFSLKVEATRIVDSGKLVMGRDGVQRPLVSLVEREQAVKVFVNDKKVRNIIYSLSNAGKSLFLHVLYTLEPGKDYIQINAEFYMKKCGIKSVNTYKAGVDDLLNYGILAATKFKTVYWINPIMFFRGNRIEKYPDNVIIGKVWNK